KQSGRTSTMGGHRVRGLLVVGEVALAVVMLSGSSLLLRSFARLLAVDPGFQPASVLTFQIQPDRKYAGAQIVAFYARLMQDLSALPGVRATGTVNDIPLGGAENMDFLSLEGQP